MSPAVCVCADLWTVCESLYRRNALDVQVSFLVLPNVCVCVCMLQKPRYSDGDLTLIYSGGEECSSGFQRMSVISFECNHTAGERGSASVGRVCGSRGVVGRSALLQTQSRRAPSVVAGRRTPPPHHQWWTHASCFHFLFVLGVGLALGLLGKPSCPAFSSHWGVDRASGLGCSTSLLPGIEFLGQPFCSGRSAIEVGFRGFQEATGWL